MTKPIVVITTMLIFLAGSAWANPLGSIGEIAGQGQVARETGRLSDCEALRRSSDLRTRLRPSERRSLIEQCERANQQIRIASNRVVGQSAH